MNAPEPVLAWLAAEGFGAAVELQSVAGGCINQGAILRTAGGPSFFLKQNAGAPQAMFQREAEGLRALVVEGGPRLPSPLLAGADFLLLEDLRPVAPAPEYWETFGRQLARLHSHTAETFGFQHDNFLGTTPQPNPPTPDGFEFFAVHRLEFQARLAFDRGRLSMDDRDQIHKLAISLRDWIPDQPPSLIHGDLWLGNALSGSAGEPALIDPAAHYGSAEAELGMTDLFGGFPDRFYAAYLEARPLEPGWRERLPIYNLYHLLNHLNLFGQDYLYRIQAIVKSFA